MATIIIDHKPYEVSQDKNLLETVIGLGLDLPYFCWHPALGSVGSCRQCAVQQMADENDQNGRLVMACMTQVKDGMRFSIEHPNSANFRKQVIEWLMVNHPHDCPVCDEGGECHLQDMTVMTGHNYRRSRFNKRTFQNQNLGPLINHEMNRCITCYRCVRFYKDVAHGDDLSAFASSGRVYFGRMEEGTLESEFSGNLVEVCPTGVFTDKVFHQNYVRKWDLATAPSICQLCSLGCNISPGERAGKLRRIQNRFHPEVNGYFICDRGRFGHEFVNSEHRLKTPVFNMAAKREQTTFAEAHRAIKAHQNPHSKLIGIGSPKASLEANWLLQQWVGAENFYDGLPKEESACLAELNTILKSHTVEMASLSDIREADCIVIVGEDVINVAPLIALSIRQAVNASRQEEAATDLSIPSWNAYSVANYARQAKLPIFSAAIAPTSMDEIAHKTIIRHPFELVQLAQGLSQAIVGEHSLADGEMSAWIHEAKAALLKAKRPVVIAGTTLGEPKVLSLMASLVSALDAKERKARLSLLLPKANSLGLALLGPKPVSRLNKSETIDMAVVLEHDLKQQGSSAFLEFFEQVTTVVAIDSLPNATTAKAAITLPCLSFAESNGSLVNNEGRLQRFFAVYKNSDEEFLPSFRLLIDLMGEEAQHRWRSIDDVHRSMAADMPILKSAFKPYERSDFTVLGRGIPRQNSEWSGRTAINANRSMHEQKPSVDIDSPLLFSMEGARTKIPLPLVSAPWEPRWNSVQAAFKVEQQRLFEHRPGLDGTRLFPKREGANKLAHIATLERKIPSFPHVYVLPSHHIFENFDEIDFCPSLKSKRPASMALLALEHKAMLGKNSVLTLGTRQGPVTLKVDFASIPEGLLIVAMGLVDASTFYEIATITIPGDIL